MFYYCKYRVAHSVRNKPGHGSEAQNFKGFGGQIIRDAKNLQIIVAKLASAGFEVSEKSYCEGFLLWEASSSLSKENSIAHTAAYQSLPRII